MADISDHVDPLVAAIYEQYEKRGKAEQSRTYLGASIIGRECSRYLWYTFRWCFKEEFEGRIIRLFQTGHMAEPRFVADLRSVGATVYDVDPATGKQFGFEEHGGHMRGHMDGCVQNVPGGGKQWHVVEFKTHGSKSFASLKKDGVKKSKPEHWVQMNWYMGKTQMPRALYLAVNKDNDELYSERLEFDPTEFAKTNAKAASIIFAGSPPPKISEDPKYYLCNMCSAKAVCHGNRSSRLSCRTCVHATPERDGTWSCAKHGPDVPPKYQRAGCGDHLPLPFLITFAQATDAGDGWIEFKRNDNDITFRVYTEGAAPAQGVVPSYTSAEISAAADHRAIGDPGIEALRNQFNAKLTEDP